MIDFGIAKLLKLGVKTTHAQQLGTALYMSPEQIEGKPADGRMDVYAMGIILYEALAGAHPIVQGDATLIDVCARQLTHRPPPLRDVAPWVPADLGALVDRAVEKDPSLRFPTMRAMSDGLGAVQRGLGTERLAAVQRLLPGASPFAVTAPVPSAAPPAGPLAGTTPPLSTSGMLAQTAPVSVDRTAAPAPPAVMAALSIRAAKRPPSRRRAVAVVVGALVLGAAGGIATTARVLAWLHAPRVAPGSPRK